MNWVEKLNTEARVVMVTRPLIQMTYSIVWQAVGMVLLASSLRSKVTRAAAPTFAATETRKAAARARVSTIVVAT